MAEQKDRFCRAGKQKAATEDVGIIIWAVIVGGQLNGEKNVNDVVEVSIASYCDFGGKSFLRLYRIESKLLKAKYIFMHNNAPSHTVTCRSVLMQKEIKAKTLMQ